MEFRGTMNSSGIAGPSVLVNVMPDPCKPVKLAVEYDTGAFLFAGGNFPGVCVCLENALTSCSQRYIFLKGLKIFVTIISV